MDTIYRQIVAPVTPVERSLNSRKTATAWRGTVPMDIPHVRTLMKGHCPTYCASLRRDRCSGGRRRYAVGSTGPVSESWLLNVAEAMGSGARRGMALAMSPFLQRFPARSPCAPCDPLLLHSIRRLCLVAGSERFPEAGSLVGRPPRASRENPSGIRAHPVTQGQPSKHRPLAGHSRPKPKQRSEQDKSLV